MENKPYIITEVEADELISCIKELQTEKIRFEKIAAERIATIENALNIGAGKRDNEIQFIKDQLRHFFNSVERKQTKTQESYNLLSGRLVMKKPTYKIAHDDVKLLEWAEQNGQHYVEVKQVSKLNWADMKKDLVISNGLILNKVTGESLEAIGLTIEEVAESFEVKN